MAAISSGGVIRSLASLRIQGAPGCEGVLGCSQSDWIGILSWIRHYLSTFNNTNNIPELRRFYAMGLETAPCHVTEFEWNPRDEAIVTFSPTPRMIAWRNGVLTEALIRSMNGNPLKVRYENQTRDRALADRAQPERP